MSVSNDKRIFEAFKVVDDSEEWQKFEEKIKDLSPGEQDAVRKFWRSVVMRTHRAFSEENGRLPPQYAVGNVRNCQCCPYGYHIDLDFVRYCEALANARPSEEELQRRNRRRSRKSMEFMLGLESLFDQWDAAERVQAVPELPQENDIDSPRPYLSTSIIPYNQRPRSSSVPRFTYGTATRAESPFGTASSTCSSSYRGAESDAPFYMRRPTNSPPETRAFLREALEDVCSDFERTLERASARRKKGTSTNGINSYGSDRNNNNNRWNGGNGVISSEKRNGHAWNPYFDTFDSCISSNKSPRSSRSYTKPAPFQQKLSPAEQQYESYVQATVAANAKSPVEIPVIPPPPPPRRHLMQTDLYSATTPSSYHPTSATSTNLSVTDYAKSPAALSSGLDFMKSPSAYSTDYNKTPIPTNADFSKTPSTGADYYKSCLDSMSDKPISALPTPTPEAERLNKDNVVTTTPVTPAPATPADAQTLFHIREQMALSLKRMKDLEEQVKSIPEMQHELNGLRSEKQRLEQMLQRKDEELQRAREPARVSASPSPALSPKQASPVQFTPQRISPISLESMGSRMRANSTSSERQLRSVLKREVGTMCGLHATRDIAVGSPVIMLRSIGTSPTQSLDLSEMLYTQLQLEERVQKALRSYEEQRTLQQLKNLISVGTQMYTPIRELRDAGNQTIGEKPVPKYSVAVTARPTTRESYVTCKPSVRSLGISEHSILDILCEKCAASKRTVASGPDQEATVDEKAKEAAAAKLQEMPVRSNTFTLGDNEKLNIKRKTVGTQYTPTTVHSASSQTSLTVVHTVGVQHQPETRTACIQSQFEHAHRQTDTKDLIHLRAVQTNTEEKTPPTQLPRPKATPPPVPIRSPNTRTTASNTEQPRKADTGMNTPPPASIRHTSSNTEQVRKRDIGCGDVVKPHISIACADNYCDSCKEAIKNLANRFSKVNAVPMTPPYQLRRSNTESKIPRPKHLSSPIPARRTIQRQNTYTISLSTTASPESEKKTRKTSLPEKPPTDSCFPYIDDPASEQESLINVPPNQEQPRRGSYTSQRTTETILSTSYTKDTTKQEAEIAPTPKDEPKPDTTNVCNTEGPLIVKEEKRVRTTWSRSNSPLPPSSPMRSLESSFNEHLVSATPVEAVPTVKKTPSPEISKGARKKIFPPKTSQKDESVKPKSPTSPPKSKTVEQKPAMSKAQLQKLAMAETGPREKHTPTPEMLTALKTINDSLLKKLGAKPFSSVSLKSSKAIIQQEWFKVTSSEEANPHEVEDYLDCIEKLSVPLLEYCVNMVDNNGNTAMHYAVSHCNFDVVSILLDSKVCNVNQMNNAGYTSVMLVSLAKIQNDAHRTVVERLFQMADVNIRAKKHSQTALMLAVSHGNKDMVEMLLTAGADINIQDDDGSTALMCAADDGRVDIVKILLSQPDCDSLIQDEDGNTAFKIAWQAGNRDLALLLYVHEQMLISKQPNRDGALRSPSFVPMQTKKKPSK